MPTLPINKARLNNHPVSQAQMPILRDTSRSDPNQSDAFNKSVSSVPMAMSMMVDSMVNMMQANLPKNAERTNATTDNGY